MFHMATCTGEIKLPAPCLEIILAARYGFSSRTVRGDRHRQSTRLVHDQTRQTVQFVGTIREGGFFLTLGAADVDLLFEADDAVLSLRPLRVARANATHRLRFVMAGLTRLAVCRLLRPQLFPKLDPKHARIGEIVILERLGFRQQEVVARDRRLLRSSGGAEKTCDNGGKNAGQAHQVTLRSRVAVVTSPFWSTHLNSMGPLSVARRRKAKYGLAERPGASLMLTTSWPA